MEDALVVIDMQKDLLTDKKPSDLEIKIAVITDIINDFRADGKPVFFVELQTKYAQYGHTLPELKAGMDEIFEKNCSDAFSNGRFCERVRPYRTLHIVGCNAEICVRLTVDSAYKNGHNVVLYKNAILSRGSSEKVIHATTLRYLFNWHVSVRNYK